MEPTTTQVPVAPTAPPAAPVAPPSVDAALKAKDFTAYKGLRHAERSGTSSTPTADPSPAPPVAQAASTDATRPAASEPATPEKPKRNADTRVQELLAERAALSRRNAELEAKLNTPPSTDVRAASSPAPASDPEPDPSNLTKYPDGQFDRQYLKDQARWEARDVQRETERNTAAAKSQTAQREAYQQRITTSAERMAKAIELDPDLPKAIRPELVHTSQDGRTPPLLETIGDLRTRLQVRDGERIPPNAITGYHAVAEELLDSDVMPQMLRHFSDHVEDLHRIAQLPAKQLLKAFVALESAFTATAPPAAAPLKHVTSAPEPVETVGTHLNTPTDPVQAAIKAKNFSAYKAQRHAQRLSQHGAR